MRAGSGFIYGEGLGHTRVTIERVQIAPDDAPGVIVAYTFTNQDDRPRHVEITWRARTELYPCWFALDSHAYADGRDAGQWDQDTRTFLAKDGENPWYAVIHSETAPDEAQTGDLYTPQGSGKGTCLSLTYRMEIPGKGSRTLRFDLSGSCESREEAEENIRLLKALPADTAKKEARLQEITALSALTTGDPAWDIPWDWAKVHTDWLIVDAGKYGTALAAGLPEYVWWFGCDSFYAIQGLLCIGQFELARQTLKLLADYSMKINGNGRIVHEITPFGLCPNPGNTQETAHFVTAVWHYWQGTGDRAFVQEMLPLLQKSMQWLQSQDEDHDLLPSGYGIIEILGLNAEMIDTAAYTCQAWECFGEMLALCGCHEEAAAARDMHRKTREVLNTVLWDEEASLYCDACASPAFVRQLLDQILTANRRKMTREERSAFERMLDRKEQAQGEAGFLINRNWTIVTPIEGGQADADKAHRALEAMHTEEMIGPWGAYLSAVDHDHTMTISTGCMAVAQAKWGHADRALDLLERMLSTFGMGNPGMISEMSPDYGCAVQAWTAYALYVPVVRYFFGIQPRGEKEALVFRPCMPEKWDHAALKRVRVPGGSIDIDYRRTGNGDEFTLTADHALRIRCACQPGWQCVQGELTLSPGETVSVIYTRANQEHQA